ATMMQAVEDVIFGNQVLPEVDLKRKKEELLANEPFWKSIEEIDPTLAVEIARKKRLKFYKWLSSLPIVRRIFQKRISQNLSQLEEQGLPVDYSMVTPNDYQTALAGEPGNYFKRALGDPRKTSIRHIEEAHSAFGKSDARESGGVERQQRSLIDTANIVIDEVISGRRDCLFIATTDQPERFDAAIYRRFVEKGKIIDISEYWQSPENLREVIRLELLRSDIRIGTQLDISCHPGVTCLSPQELDRTVERIYGIFEERTLKITPAYVRKLVHSLIEIKESFSPAFLEDALLVRRAFELVARNSYGDLYQKVVDRMDRHVLWEQYVGDIKNTFSEMSNNCLYYRVSEEKGVVLNGPPGSGKTFLVRTWLSENADVHDISTSPGALQDPMNPVDGAVDNLEKVYDIAKMIAPTVVFFDEGDSLAPKRSASGGAPADKLTNKFLNLIDGEIPLNRVFTVLTTNRLDILDPALIRSKRLKVLEVSGHLRKEDIVDIIELSLEGVPLAERLDVQSIVESAQGLCNTPADYSAFVEKAKSLRSTEYEVLLRLRQLERAGEADLATFVKFNFKTLLGILEAMGAPKSLRSAIVKDPTDFAGVLPEILLLVKPVRGVTDYPLMHSHLLSARKAIAQSPTRKGKVQLDEFLEAELSQEPQVGFIIGVGANDLTGVLLPIATSLTYGLSSERVLVTGAVSSSAPAAAEMEMAVKMTQQSAQEALTMVKNYLQELDTKVNITRLLGEFLADYTIHHQLLSASYNVGGPSAGYALAINTLSALLHLPVYHDFGITGAPWTKGVKRGEVGGSVIIGGHKKKTEKVLVYLRRMYMPLQNYKDLELEFLTTYWQREKDVLGVTHFGDLVPEVLWLGPEQETRVREMMDTRIQYKLEKFQGATPRMEDKERILRIKADLRMEMENEIVHRLQAIREYLRNPMRDPHVSMDEIFHRSREPQMGIMEPIRRFLQGRKNRMRS
ncbi:MAG: AAA family ATPase, partial [Desulfobacteraceae bacterium]|nr:AAA family ATPase [Desulfobacteraceae bacterium]